MDVTIESEEQTRERLLRVFASADVRWLPGEYAFREVQEAEEALADLASALAIVRDDNRWSILRCADASSEEKYRIFSCHFSAEIPNSGFVGWLASELKRNLGTRVFVVCGQNTARGGIFDYWGVPLEVGDQAEQFISLRFQSPSADTR